MPTNPETNPTMNPEGINNVDLIFKVATFFAGPLNIIQAETIISDDNNNNNK